MNNDQNPKAPIRSWASARLPSDIQAALDKLARSDDVRHIAVMPDIHLAPHVCVGTAFATTELIYPDAIGGDIGCGMAGIAFENAFRKLPPKRALRFLQMIRLAVPIRRQSTEAADTLRDSVPNSADLSSPELQSLAVSTAASQLGTLGTGNHFLELQYDSASKQLWLMVHSGSRNLGQVIRAAHIKSAIRSRSGLKYLDINTTAGAAYLNDMHWARRFAQANRAAMLNAVGMVAGGLFGWQTLEDSRFDCDHNHINHESHFAQSLFVHRKGAMAADRHVVGAVPGSMATPSFHVTGRGVEDALCSSAHGAGRTLTRSAARKRINRPRLLRELQHVHFDPKTVISLREEAPSAYKDIHAVMNAQRKLVRIRRTLLPLLTHKGVS